MESVERGQTSKIAIENIQAENKERVFDKIGSPELSDQKKQYREKALALSRNELLDRKKKLDVQGLKLEAIKKGLESGAIPNSKERTKMVKSLEVKIKQDQLRILLKEQKLRKLQK